MEAAALDAVMETARALWPLKTAAHLAAAAGASERRAEQWLDRTANPSATALIRLLFAPEGGVFHDAMMTAAGAAPGWYADREKALRAHSLRRELELLERG